MCAKKAAAPKKKGSRPAKKAKTAPRPARRKGTSGAAAIASAAAGGSSSSASTTTPVVGSSSSVAAIQRVFNCQQSPPIPGELIAGVHDIGPAGRLMRAAPPPDKLDLREDWWKIGDQGKTGACVGWAIGDGLMRYYWTKKNKLSPGDEGLSVRYVWMGAKETDEFGSRPTTFLETAGTSIRSALELFKNHGCVRESQLSLMGGLSTLSENDFFLAAQEFVPTTPYTNIKIDSGVWKRWLFKEGPIAVRLEVDHSFLNYRAADAPLSTYVAFGNRKDMGHAVVIVGYNDNDQFIIRNSWGTTAWGDNGFALATFDYLEEAVTESFGVYFTF